MRRHIQTTGPFKQLNQKSLPESFTRKIPVQFWEVAHTFFEIIREKLYIYFLIDFFLLFLDGN